MEFRPGYREAAAKAAIIFVYAYRSYRGSLS